MSEALIRRCTACRTYSLRIACPACGAPTGTAHPARYSPQDRWAKYRRALYAAAAAPGRDGA